LDRDQARVASAREPGPSDTAGCARLADPLGAGCQHPQQTAGLGQAGLVATEPARGLDRAPDQVGVVGRPFVARQAGLNRQAGSKNTARVAVKPCRKARPPTGPISPPQKKPASAPVPSSSSTAAASWSGSRSEERRVG